MSELRRAAKRTLNAILSLTNTDRSLYQGELGEALSDLCHALEAPDAPLYTQQQVLEAIETALEASKNENRSK